MSSIYRADAGRIRMAGRLAPFIELGVGFNPDLTSRENVVLNGVMMGLGRREAQRRLDAVLDFAELRDFTDLKLKNYSSGMMVRLAFAVMVEADADIMLIDEVLAVGDAAFAQKCMDVFRDKRAAGRTIVLVTHDMATVQALCDRAMLIHDGELRYAGDPRDGAPLLPPELRRRRSTEPDPSGGARDVNVKVLDARSDAPGTRRQRRAGRADQLDCCSRRVTTSQALSSESISSMRRGRRCSASTARLLATGEGPVAAGERVRLAGTIENPLLPGPLLRQLLDLAQPSGRRLALHVVRLVEFVVFGTRPGPGDVAVRNDVEVRVERGGAA